MLEDQIFNQYTFFLHNNSLVWVQTERHLKRN